MKIEGQILSVRKRKDTDTTFLVLIKGQDRYWGVDEDHVTFVRDSNAKHLYLEGADLGIVGQVSLPYITGPDQLIDWLSEKIGFTPCPCTTQVHEQEQ